MEKYEPTQRIKRKAKAPSFTKDRGQRILGILKSTFQRSLSDKSGPTGLIGGPRRFPEWRGSQFRP